MADTLNSTEPRRSPRSSRRRFILTLFAAVTVAVGVVGIAIAARRPAAKPYLAAYFASGLLEEWWAKSPAESDLVRTIDGGKADGVRLAVTGSSYGPNPSSELTAISLSKLTSLAHATSLQDTWYRVGVRYPGGGLYRPTTGHWNWNIAWHNDGHTTTFNSKAFSIEMGVYTDYPVVRDAYGRRPRLVLRLMGGNTLSPTVSTCSLRPNSLRLGAWYDLLFHFVWSSDARVGLAEWWVDGKKVCKRPFPTLYRNPDGTESVNNFGLYNYRLHASWPSAVDFGYAVIGPTRSSVRE